MNLLSYVYVSDILALLQGLIAGVIMAKLNQLFLVLLFSCL